MKKIIYVILLCLIIAVFYACFYAGYKYREKTTEPAIKEVEVIKTVDHLVYRDYPLITHDELLNKLVKYDTMPMKLTYTTTETKPEYTGLVVSWELYERNGSEEIKVPVHQEGNWKFYTGIACGAVVIGGLVYMLK